MNENEKKDMEVKINGLVKWLSESSQGSIFMEYYHALNALIEEKASTEQDLRTACSWLACHLSKPNRPATTPKEVAESNGWNCFHKKVFSVKDSDGDLMKISYDENGQIERIEYENGDCGIPTYDARGNIVLVKWNNGLEDRWEFDKRGECVAAWFGVSKKESEY